MLQVGSLENLIIFTVGPEIGAIGSIPSNTKYVKLLFSVLNTIWGEKTEHLFFKKTSLNSLY